MFCLVQCSVRRFLSNRATPKPSCESRASSWMSEVAFLFVRSERGRTGWREEMNCDIVKTKASADPTESYGADMALQSRPTLRKGLIPYISPSPQWAVIGCRPSLGGGKTLGESTIFLAEVIPENSTESHLLGEWMIQPWRGHLGHTAHHSIRYIQSHSLSHTRVHVCTCIMWNQDPEIPLCTRPYYREI